MLQSTEVQVSDPKCVELTEGEKALLTPEQLRNWEAEKERQMFGDGFKRDRHGNPIEQGIGSDGHETANHFRAMRESERLGFEEPGTSDRKIAEFIERHPARAKAIGILKAAPAASE